QGNDKYEGGGGTVMVSGVKAWSNTGGLDIVDYKLAGDTPLTIDLSKTGAQNTGFGTATFRNIEGLAGGHSADIFVDNAADNQFEGRGGNDNLILTGGGRDTLLYKLLAASDATGGNGSDDVYAFEVGAFAAWPNADRIDVRELLVGFTPANEASYLKVSVVNGRDTVISVDRDGADGGFDFAPLLTLRGVQTDLATLLANQQLVMV
ncbi:MULTISPECIES: type I secretion C-terminal target domain-containing protein, partial [unclassified Variovorax]